MLYEVITSLFSDVSSFFAIGIPYFLVWIVFTLLLYIMPNTQVNFRITSYNVCYTKLSRGNVFFSEKPFIAVDDFVAVPSGFTKQDTLVWFNDIHDPKIDVISGTNQNIFFKLVETVNKPVDQIINYTTKFGRNNFV